MHADHTGHDRPKHKTPEYFYDTPFSLIAFMLALMMIIPIPRVMPTPEARADGANGVCEQICSGSICGISDPNDPDCAIGCACNDGTTVLIIGIPDVNTCNTSATCQNHGGWVGGGGELGGCGSLEFFNGGTVCSADVHAVDPGTGAVLVNESLLAGQQLGALERQAIDEVLTLHGLPAADKDRLLAWARDRVRAQLFAKLVDIINKPATERTANEQVLYNWLTNIVWQKRIDPAQKAWEQFEGWQNAVEYATCSWQPPNSVYWQPKWRTAANDPQLISCQADVNLGGQTAQRLCQINGCSPGNDGIPRTDPTPNSAGNPLNPNDDGEICFASGSLTYDACTLSRCAGTPALPGCSVAIPAHPSYEQFKGYGATLARKNFVYNPSFLSIAGNTSKAASFGIALGAAVLIAGAVTGVTAAAGGLAAFSGAVFPFAATAGTAAAFAALALFATVLIVVLAVLTAIIAGISVAEFAQLPGQLQTDVRNAASTTNTAQGKPNLATLITTDAGKQEIFLAFIETVGPEIDLSGRTAPAPENEPLWAVMDQNRTPLPTESGQLLTFTSWDDILGEAGLFGGWFVPQITQSGGATQNTLALGIEYVNSNGEQWTAWRTKCQDQTNAACTFGEAIFVHTRNGDEPPTGLSEEEFAAWFANASKEIAYKNGVGSSRIARLNRRPTATGIAVAGTQTEGQQLTFTGAASDPDLDTVSSVWNFNDGTSNVTGSPVQHAFLDNGTFQVQMTPTDVFGATGTVKTQAVAIANAPPVVGSISGPTGRVSPNTTINLSANFTDPGIADTHTAAWDWGDGATSAGTLQETNGSGTVSGSHAYTKGGSYSVELTVTDDDAGAAQKTFALTVNKRLTVLDPAQVWIGLKNSDNVGLRVDLQAEVLLNDKLVGVGQLTNVATGSSGFNNALLNLIPLTLSAPQEIAQDATLALRVSARRTCAAGSSHNAGTVRLWYNGQPLDSGATRDAGSRVVSALDQEKITYFLRGGAPLGLHQTAGAAKQSLDVAVDSKTACPNRPFTPFGTWEIRIP